MRFAIPVDKDSHQVDAEGFGTLCRIFKRQMRRSDTTHEHSVRCHFFELAILHHVFESANCKQVGEGLFRFTIPPFFGEEDESGNPEGAEMVDVKLAVPSAGEAMAHFRKKMRAFALEHYRKQPLTESDEEFLRTRSGRGGVDETLAFYR